MGLKMARVVICRHGTSLWNLEKRWQGERDIDLAPEGEEQAHRQAEQFTALGMHFDSVYSTDLKRGYRTAEILAAKDGLVPVADSRLRECSLGVWEGMHRDEVKGPLYVHIFERLNAMSHEERIGTAYFDGLETPVDMAARARAVAMDAIQVHGPGSSVLIITHSTIMEALLAVEHGHHFEGISMRNLAWFEWAVDANDSSQTLALTRT